MPIRLVVLDLAGTTIEDDGNVLRCLHAAAREHGIPATEEALNARMGTSKLEVFRALAPDRDEVGREARARAAFDTYHRLMVEAYRQEVHPLPGVEESLAALRRAGVRVALDTGFDRAIMDLILDRLGWRGRCVDADVCVDDVGGRGRPAPYLIFRAMEKTGVEDVRSVAKVGDTPADLLEGTRAGCALVVGVLSGAHTASSLGRVSHTHLIASVAELPALLEIGA